MRQHALSTTQGLAKFKMAIDSMPDMVVITDPKGYIVYVNKAGERITGLSLKDVIGKEATILLQQTPPLEFYQQLWHTIKTKKEVFEADVRGRRANGEEYEAHISISPVLDSNDNIMFYVGVERDVTREKEIERAKTDFVFLASHQLRTPSAIIRWSIESLLGDKSPPLPAEQKQLLQQVFQANSRMIKLVDTMLHISRVESGTITNHPEKINVAEFVRQELAIFQPEIHQKQLDVTVNCAPRFATMHIDKNFMQIICHNLLSNAIKYTPENGKVKISISRSGAMAKFAFTDTGCGIPKAQQSHIFTKMFRADNARMLDSSGSGLGLYLVKLLVEFLHGSISFTSHENKGTTFYVTLPFRTKDPSK